MATRCPSCNVPLTSEEANRPACPVCDGPLVGVVATPSLTKLGTTKAVGATTNPPLTTTAIGPISILGNCLARDLLWLSFVCWG